VYEYRFHHGKLEFALGFPKQQHLQPIQTYLNDIAETFPHQLFQTDARASQGKTTYNLDAVEIKSTRNHACRVAELVLQTVTNNKRRHDEIQRFMLATDSVTVAVEVPIYLSAEELADYKRTAGFDIPLQIDTTLTGHIDFLQIRNGAIYIVDYKPGSKSEKPIAQLMVYALALSRRTGLRLFDMVCSWCAFRAMTDRIPD
jgi:ATP-dependent exoDNAse (exonuclease V) beta subunit